MAWRGAIAISKGIKLRKIQEQNKDERLKKAKTKKPTMKRQSTLFSNNLNNFNSVDGFDIESQLHNTDEGLSRNLGTMGRSNSILGNYGIGDHMMQNQPQLSLAGMRKINTWCNALNEDEIEESSIQSSDLSSVNPYRSPSNPDFDEYQNRRSHFLARLEQPQDCLCSDAGQSLGANTSQRKLIQAYE